MILEERIVKISELFVRFLHRRISLAEDGVVIEQEMPKLNDSNMINYQGGKVYIRKLIKIFKDHFLNVTSEEKILEIFSTDLR